MATFTKQKNGKTRVQIRKKGYNLSEVFGNKREAKLWADRKEAEILGGKSITASNKTLRDVLSQYIKAGSG